jgi:hypothetical protein
MKYVKYWGVMALFVLFVAGCGGQKEQKTSQAMQSLTKENANYTAELSGKNEVPDSVSTMASGEALFKLNADQEIIDYTLTVSNIDSVTMAHIHLGSASENGPILVWLYPVSGPPPQVMPGPVNGVLAQGSITAANLIGPLKGKTVADLEQLMKEDSTYVQVHTQKYPEGEIRGQIIGKMSSESSQTMGN